MQTKDRTGRRPANRPWALRTLALLLSSLTVHFRDLRDLVANLLTLWFWGGSNGAVVSTGSGALPDYTPFSRCLRDALFAVTSLGTGTGYATADFGRWPDACSPRMSVS